MYLQRVISYRDVCGPLKRLNAACPPPPHSTGVLTHSTARTLQLWERPWTFFCSLRSFAVTILVYRYIHVHERCGLLDTNDVGGPRTAVGVNSKHAFSLTPPPLPPSKQVAFDKVILLLCRFTGLIEQSRTRPRPSSRGNNSAEGSLAGAGGVTRLLNGNPAARTAAVAAFGIAHRLGDHMREGEEANVCRGGGKTALFLCVLSSWFSGGASSRGRSREEDPKAVQ